MFISLYALSFCASIISLVAWFYFNDQSRLSKFFKTFLFLGLGAYLASVFAVDAVQFETKLAVVFRDFMALGVVGFLFHFLARNKVPFIIGLIGLALGLGWWYKSNLQTAFVTSDNIVADQNGELLVELSEGRYIIDLEKTFKDYELNFQRAFDPERPNDTELDDYYVVDVPKWRTYSLESLQEKMEESGLVDWVEINEVINVNPIPAKLPSKINQKFGINDPGLDKLWGFEAMQVDQLYKYLQENKIKPQKKALIAILDTGVDANHEDIKSNFKSIKKKYNDDPRGHGTHCAGIAGAVSNNGKGVASFSRNNEFVQLTSIKVLSSSGMGTQKSIIDGIILAADKGADVISLSLGGRSNQAKQKAYKKAVNYANKRGAIVVAAAGNSNRNAKDYSPVNAPGVIGVSAVDEQLNRATFSNFVQDIKYGIAAPGVNIYSTIPNNKYAVFNGTSMATPYVSGLIGLLKSIQPDLTTAQAHHILTRSGISTKKTVQTGKFIQPKEAVKLLLNK